MPTWVSPAGLARYLPARRELPVLPEFSVKTIDAHQLLMRAHLGSLPAVIEHNYLFGGGDYVELVRDH
ncbi:hypothetical protein [Trueperella pecoris]|uniref:hypothetical protein n=1 Tax=Trueperella pecoris TaxID=2733571 RepID=UPI00186B87CC|nr:hypothetical protein [Trueperella pecoris]QOQ39632.1 hypothetical protein HLG82_09400 [Trueperella pecoris]